MKLYKNLKKAQEKNWNFQTTSILNTKPFPRFVISQILKLLIFEESNLPL